MDVLQTSLSAPYLSPSRRLLFSYGMIKTFNVFNISFFFDESKFSDLCLVAQDDVKWAYPLVLHVIAIRF